MRLFCVVCIFAHLAAAGCGSPAESVANGRLCTPATSDCPSKTRLSGSTAGRNLLDVALENRGPEATATLDISFEPEGDVQLTDATNGDSGLNPPGEDPVFPVRYELSPDDRVEDRFHSTEIFNVPRLFVALDCRACPNCEESCDVQADYVFMTEANECSSDSECSGEKFCNPSAGLCVECLEDSDCNLDQSCDKSSGRCRPPDSRGCSQAVGPVPLPALLVLLVALVSFRSVSRRPRPSSFALAAALGLSASVLPAEAAAETPGSTLSIGVGPRWVTGPLGRDVQRGIGIELREIVRGRHVGASASIAASYFVTNQPSPPLSRELQVFGFGIGPRAFVPVGPVEVMAGAGYRRVGFAPNALVRRTGTDSNFNAVGGSVGAGYRWSRFVLRVDGSLHPILELEGSLAAGTVSFGVSTR